MLLLLLYILTIVQEKGEKMTKPYDEEDIYATGDDYPDDDYDNRTSDQSGDQADNQFD